jgi:hypothetical protein
VLDELLPVIKVEKTRGRTIDCALAELLSVTKEKKREDRMMTSVPLL